MRRLEGADETRAIKQCVELKVQTDQLIMITQQQQSRVDEAFSCV